MTVETTIAPVRFFSQGEYERRLAVVRERMAQKDVETLLVFVPENVLYLSGYQTIGFSTYMCLIVPATGSPTLVLREMEVGCAHYYAWVTDISFYADHQNPVEAVVEALQARGLAKGRIGIERDAAFVGATRTLYLEELLNKAGAIPVDASGSVEYSRARKSAEELEYLRQSARATEAGIQAAVDASVVGATENEIALAAYAAIVTRPGTNYMATVPIVTSGPRSGVAHTTWDSRVVQNGDTILIEIGSTVNRYTSALMRTVALGEQPPEVARMYAACVEGLEGAIAKIKAGVTSGEVDDVTVAVMDKYGYEPKFRKRTGYSVGVSFPPGWGEGHIVSIRQKDNTVLEPGMVFHMPPALREYGKWCVGVSETVLVTETGCEVLTNLSRELFTK